METELFTLYNVLNFYKHSLLEILNKIDETILQAVTTYENNQLRDAFAKKFTISMEMVAGLQHYVKMLHTCETIYKDLTAKLSELEQSTDPERERCNTNPFTLSVLRSNDESSSPSTSDEENVEVLTRQDSTPSTSSEERQITSPVETSSSDSTVKTEMPHLQTFDRRDISNTPIRLEQSTNIDRIHTSPNEDFKSNLKFKVRSDLTEHFKVDKSPRSPSKRQRSSEGKDNSIGTGETRPEPPGTSTTFTDVKNTNNTNKDSISVGRNVKVYGTARPLPELPINSEKVVKSQQEQVNTCAKVSSENHGDNSDVIPADKNVVTSTRMPRHDRRQEVVKKSENKSLKKTVQWAPALTQTEILARNDGDKKPKGRTVSNVADGNLSVNQKCIVCHVESPSEFYVRTDQSLFESFENRFNEDMNKQHQYVVNKFKTKSEAKTNLGTFCFGFMSTRRKWYRIEVLDWMEHEIDTIFVQLIDYGEKIHWSYTHLKAMADLYALFTKMAIKCHLAGIYSPNLDGTKRWPKASIDYFMEVCDLAVVTQFVTIFVHKEGSSYAVDLRTTKDKNADSLGELLVKNNHAFEVKISQDYDFSSEGEEEFDNVNEAVAGYDAQDEARICPFTDESGGCFKGTSCTLEHGLLSSDGITTDKVLTINQTMTLLDLPPPGDIVDILITGYVDTCHFYAQILESSPGELFNDKFERLMDAMQANNIVHESFKIYPGIGEIVLVKHESKWYRGRCVGYTDNECLEIFLVDVGYTVIKKLKDLKVMKEDFTYLPFQAVECILNNCQEKKDASGTLSRKFFDSVMKMKTFKGHVMKSTYQALRLQLSDEHDMDMCHVLKQWGLGEDRDNDFYPASDCSRCCE